MPHSRLGIKRKWAENVAKTRARNTQWSRRANTWRENRLSPKKLMALHRHQQVTKANSVLTQFSTSTSAFLLATPKVNTSGSGRDSSAGNVAGTYGQTHSNLFRKLKRKLRNIRKRDLSKLAINNNPPDNTDDDILEAADNRGQ